jgi:hypothetical protein
MRFDTLALALLGVGSLSVAAAADPAPATPSERAAASAAVVTDSAPVSTSAPTKVPAPPPASSPAASPTAASELSTAEQRLINLGYKPQMRNGEKIYCRREAALGSRISAGQHCGTVTELSTTTQEGKDYLEKTQRSQLNPVGH